MHVNAFIYFFRFSLYLYTDQHITPIVDYVSQLICHLFNEPREYFLIYFSYFWSSWPAGGTFIGKYRICMWSIHINILPSILLVFTEQYPANWPCIWDGQTIFVALDYFLLFMHFDFGAYFI